jgi:hypothetical protein
MGFAPERLEQMLRAAGLQHIEVERVPARARERFRVVLATATASETAR